MKRWMAGLIALSVVAGPPVFAQPVSPDDVAAARAAYEEASARLDEQAAVLEEAWSRESQLTDQLARLNETLDQARIELNSSREAVKERAVEMYMTGSPRLHFFKAADDWSEQLVLRAYMEDVATSDSALIARLDVAAAAYTREQAAIEQTLADQETVRRQLETVTAELGALLDERSATYQAIKSEYDRQEAERRRLAAEEQRRKEEEQRRLEEERRRQEAATTTTTTTVATGGATTTTTTAPAAPDPGTASPAMVCPVAGPVSFVDSWGDPRSGGRSHQGVDMLAARGTPLVAVESGTIKRKSTSTLGGITIWLEGRSGDAYYYAHLDAWAAGLTQGMSVNAGDLVGTVGTTGNAPENVPHLHFERHPGGGAAVNPYPFVRGLC